MTKALNTKALKTHCDSLFTGFEFQEHMVLLPDPAKFMFYLSRDIDCLVMYDEL